MDNETTAPVGRTSGIGTLDSSVDYSKYQNTQQKMQLLQLLFNSTFATASDVNKIVKSIMKDLEITDENVQ